MIPNHLIGGEGRGVGDTGPSVAATLAAQKPISLLLFLLIILPAAQCGVTYDGKAVIINGRRRILISGSIHYPWSTPDMWEGLVQKAKDGGLDVIQTYVFRNGREPSPVNYNFAGRYEDSAVHLRIGPYVTFVASGILEDFLSRHQLQNGTTIRSRWGCKDSPKSLCK